MQALAPASAKWLVMPAVAILLVASCGSDLMPEAVKFYQGRGTIITITYVDNACMTAERSLDITETDTEVIVDLRSRRTGAMCTNEGIQVTSEVLLTERLGDRAMVDASTDAQIPRADCRRPERCMPNLEP